MPDGGQHLGGSNFPALVLNADFRPLSYFPLSVWSWQDAVKAVYLDRVSVLSEYDVAVHSPSKAFRLPSVIALKDYIHSARKPAFTRFNVFLRDTFACQYCGERYPTQELTFDHVIPAQPRRPDHVGKRRQTSSLPVACCNLRKGSKLPRECRMYPRHKPCQPTTWEYAGERPRLPAELPACQLARLPVLRTASWRADPPGREVPHRPSATRTGIFRALKFAPPAQVAPATGGTMVIAKGSG